MISDKNFTINEQGCFKLYDPVACAREAILAFLATVTFLICMARIIKFHVVKHLQIQHYIIFYLGAINCAACVVLWLASEYYSQLAIITSYIKLLLVTLVCHCYWTLVARVIHREQLIKCAIVPFLVIFVVFFTSVSVFGMIKESDVNRDCFRIYCVALSGGDFVLVQLFTVACALITRKINYVSATDNFKYSQKRNLWGLAIILEISSTLTLTYDLTMKTLSDRQFGCSSLFLDDQVLYSSVMLGYVLMKFLLPIWTMLAIFRPIPRLLIDSIQDLGWSGTSDTSSLTSSVIRGMAIAKSKKSNHFPSSPKTSGGSPHLLSSPQETNDILNNISYRLSGGNGRSGPFLNNLSAISEEPSISSRMLSATNSRYLPFDGGDQAEKMLSGTRGRKVSWVSNSSSSEGSVCE